MTKRSYVHGNRWKAMKIAMPQPRLICRLRWGGHSARQNQQCRNARKQIDPLSQHSSPSVPLFGYHSVLSPWHGEGHWFGSIRSAHHFDERELTSKLSRTAKQACLGRYSQLAPHQKQGNLVSERESSYGQFPLSSVIYHEHVHAWARWCWETDSATVAR